MPSHEVSRLSSSEISMKSSNWPVASSMTRASSTSTHPPSCSSIARRIEAFRGESGKWSACHSCRMRAASAACSGCEISRSVDPRRRMIDHEQRSCPPAAPSATPSRGRTD